MINESRLMCGGGTVPPQRMCGRWLNADHYMSEKSINSMRIKIYDSKQLGNKMWYLGSGNLYEYLSHLRPDFFMYKIQRRLVTNRYLDGIYQTIELGEPIPPLTLRERENGGRYLFHANWSQQ